MEIVYTVGKVRNLTHAAWTKTITSYSDVVL